jgi:hypothetical protein
MGQVVTVRVGRILDEQIIDPVGKGLQHAPEPRSMHAIVADGKVTVKGTYPVTYDGQEIDRYKLTLSLPDDYSRSLPKVCDTDERISRVLDRHVYPATGALCLGVPAALWIAMGGNFTIEHMLDIPVGPQLSHRQ